MSQLLELDEAGWHAERDALARRLLNLSEIEFVQAFSRGELDDHPDLMAVLVLFPELD